MSMDGLPRWAARLRSAVGRSSIWSPSCSNDGVVEHPVSSPRRIRSVVSGAWAWASIIVVSSSSMSLPSIQSAMDHEINRAWVCRWGRWDRHRLYRQWDLDENGWVRPSWVSRWVLPRPASYIAIPQMMSWEWPRSMFLLSSGWKDQIRWDSIVLFMSLDRPCFADELVRSFAALLFCMSSTYRICTQPFYENVLLSLYPVPSYASGSIIVIMSSRSNEPVDVRRTPSMPPALLSYRSMSQTIDESSSSWMSCLFVVSSWVSYEVRSTWANRWDE